MNVSTLYQARCCSGFVTSAVIRPVYIEAVEQHVQIELPLQRVQPYVLLQLLLCK